MLTQAFEMMTRVYKSVDLFKKVEKVDFQCHCMMRLFNIQNE